MIFSNTETGGFSIINILNPILKGFNPDPSICKVGDTYYIATSTFEWFPGVQIHHSKDLKNWSLIARPLNRVSQLNMLGVPDSGGIWAPCLSYNNGSFYLIYTIVYSTGVIKDTHNFLVTAKDVRDDWSEPVYLNSSGFDPSLFHDDDGRKWLINMKWSNRIGKNKFGGHVLQEYDEVNKQLIGPVVNIFRGTELGYTEGPHIYKHNAYYYLMIAEGGTGYKHAVTLARAKEITGPYEIHPENPILTSAGSNMHDYLQKAGHASIVESNDNEWYMVHLCGRPLPGTNYCILGRETALQKVEWRDDDWLYLISDNGKYPEWEIEVSTTKESQKINSKNVVDSLSNTHHDDFDKSVLNIHFQSLRIPATEFFSLTDRPGFLRLYGREFLNSKFRQSLIARRQQSFSYTAETCLEFEPENYQQLAGLVCYYNTTNYYYLRVSTDDELGGKCIGIISCINDNVSESMKQEDNILLGDSPRIYLKAEVDYSELRFFYAVEEGKWKQIGDVYDASTLSDEAIKGTPAFTGAFVGMVCQDLSGSRKHADFDYFYYTEKLI